MTVSRASAVLAPILGCVLWAGAAAAQTESLSTVPPSVPTNPLDRVGLVDGARSGMPGWMWRGTSMARAKALILDLPAAPQSRVLRDLQFRLLTTSATPPSADGAPGASLFILRVERLAAMAEAESAHELLRQANGREDSATSRLVTESLFRVDQRASACSRVTATGHKDVWWQQAAVLCQIDAKETDAARTGLDSLRAEPGADPAFIALATRVLSGAAGGPVPFSEDGLTLALLDLGNLPVPVTDIDSFMPGVMRAAIENKAVPLERRVEIAERAERSGVIEPDRLAEFYGELSRGLKDSAATSPTAWRAVVFAQAQGATSNEQRVILAHRLYAVSRDTAGSAVRALAPAITAARPAPAHAEFATAGFLATLTLERFDRASEWFAAAQGGAAPAAADRIALLAPLAAIARLPDRPPLDVKTIERRAALQPDSATALHAVLWGLEVAPREVLLPLLAKATKIAPDPAVIALINAAQAGRYGETLCRIAALAGTTPVASLDPDKVEAILRALVLINRRDAARSFAIEYAILAGL